MIYYIFYHPEPKKEKTSIIPIFIPFFGCPKRCIYCAQPLQTGNNIKSLDKTLKILIETLENKRKKGQKGFELAFFGGTFTGISLEWIKKFLNIARKFKHNGVLKKIRCSTRPDFVDKEKLNFLKDLGMDIVELGIQTFDDHSLFLSKRGYTGSLAKDACYLVKEAGLELGIQLLPGLPGFSKAIWTEDIKKTIQIQPKFVRIYPCIVLKGTILEKKYLAGEYKPLELNNSVKLISRGVLKLWRHNIPVIRIGLHNEKSLRENIIAGPWDPGYGSMVRSYILSKIIYTYLIFFNGNKIKKILIPQRFSGEIWGKKGNYKKFYEKLGLKSEQIEFTKHEYFAILC